MKSIASRLKELRAIKDIDQQTLAEVACVSRSAMSKYEKGTAVPMSDKLINIAKEYDVSLDWLCGLSDNMGMGRAIKTLSDLLYILPSLLSIKQIELEYHEAPNEYMMDGEPRWTIAFYNEDVQKAMVEYKRMYDLYTSGVVDDELFALWQEKMYKKYRNIEFESEEKKDPDIPLLFNEEE